MTLRGRRRWLVALLALAALLFFLSGQELPPREELTAKMESLGLLAMPLAILLFAAASMFGVPGSLLVATSVWLFGLYQGLGVTAIGAMLSASGAFWIARRLGREKLLAWLSMNERWQRLDEEIGRYGGWVVLAVRLLPSLPFTALNYLCGLTQVRFLPYLLATFGGILPRLMIFALAAEHVIVPAASGLTPWHKPGFWWALGLVLIFLVALPLALRRRSWRESRLLAPLARILGSAERPPAGKSVASGKLLS